MKKYKEHFTRLTGSELELFIDFLSGLTTEQEKAFEEKYDGLDVQELLGHFHNIYETN